MQKKAPWFYSKVGVATLLLALLTIIYVVSAWAQESGEPSALDKANATIGAVLFFDIAFGLFRLMRSIEMEIRCWTHPAIPRKRLLVFLFLLLS